MSSETGSPPPAAQQHCKNVYEAMVESSEEEEGLGLVYEGYLTKVFQQLELSTPYYSSITSQLKDMDCIRQLRRGGGSTPSQWLLVQAPTDELFAMAAAKVAARKDKAPPVDQRINDLSSRLAVIERALADLIQ